MGITEPPWTGTECQRVNTDHEVFVSTLGDDEDVAVSVHSARGVNTALDKQHRMTNEMCLLDTESEYCQCPNWDPLEGEYAQVSIVYI